jgi:hypothetical protein
MYEAVLMLMGNFDGFFLGIQTFNKVPTFEALIIKSSAYQGAVVLAT